MEPEPEAEFKLRKVDKKRLKMKMDQNSDEIRRAAFLMSPFNMNEVRRHERIRRGLGYFGLSAAGIVVIAGLLLTFCHKG